MASTERVARSGSIEKNAAESVEEDVSVKPVIAYGGEETLPPPPELDAEQQKALYRKIDLRLMPILTLMYLCSFLDRGNIGAYYFDEPARAYVDLPLQETRSCRVLRRSST